MAHEGQATEPSSHDGTQPGGQRRFNSLSAMNDVLAQPEMTMPRIVAARPWVIALMLYVASSVSSAVALLTTPPPDARTLARLPPQWRRMLEGMFPLADLPDYVEAVVIVSPFTLIVATMVSYLVGWLLGGRGSFQALLATQGYGNIPNLPLGMLMTVINLANPGFGRLAVLLITIVAIAWTWRLSTLGIRLSLNLSAGGAVFLMIIFMVVEFGFTYQAVDLLLPLLELIDGIVLPVPR